MKLFAIADTHLSFGVDKPMDVFRGWENYVERLKNFWESTISEEDTVMIAGDISWGMNLEEALPDFQFLHQLPGTKIFLKGNHDYWFGTKKKTEDFWKQHGLDSLNMLFNNFFPFGEYGICGTRGWLNEPGEPAQLKVIQREAARLRMSLDACLKEKKEPIVFLHYPPVSKSGNSEEITNVLEEYHIKRVYYGHLHGASHQHAIQGLYHGTNYTLIAGDYLRFEPIVVEETGGLDTSCV